MLARQFEIFWYIDKNLSGIHLFKTEKILGSLLSNFYVHTDFIFILRNLGTMF